MSKKTRLSKLSTGWQAKIAHESSEGQNPLLKSPADNSLLSDLLLQKETFETASQYLTPEIWAKVEYTLETLNDDRTSLDSTEPSAQLDLLPGRQIQIDHTGEFACCSCLTRTKKLFDGYCFRCLKSKASADQCIMSPHLCHYMAGTCREPQWGLNHCYQPHVLYISYTDKFKVGITRQSQIPTRWFDQGATAACAIALTSSRHQVGIIEHALKEVISDRSHWSNMLKCGNRGPSTQEFQECVKMVFAFVTEKILPAENSYICALPADSWSKGETKPITWLENAPIQVQNHQTDPKPRFPTFLKNF